MQTFFPPHRDQKSWTHPLEKVLYPRGLFSPTEPAPGVPRVGDATCLSGEDGQRSTQPGLHFPMSDGPPVVWWDPATLSLDAPLPFGLKQEQYLAPNEDPAVEQSARSTYRAWRQHRAEAIDTGNIASVVPLAASEASHDPPDFNGFVDEIVLPIVSGRPGGIRFGALVHAVLKDVALDADRPNVAAVAKLHARILGAPAEEAEAAVEAVTSALTHELFVRARAAQTCHREWPILYSTEDGETLDGALDLAFIEDGQWVIVDFKTDHDPKTRVEQYRRQMAWYVHALSETTQTPAYGILFRI